MAKTKTKITKKENGGERDRFTVVLEAIQSDFQVFGEKLDFIDARLDKIGVRLDKIEVRLDKIEVRLDKMDARLDKIEVRLDKVEASLESVKSEIADIKMRLVSKADLDKLQNLEERVRRLEIALAQKKN
mgnify:CR=1 FL=1